MALPLFEFLRMNVRKLVLCFCLVGLCGLLAAQNPPEITFSQTRINCGSFPISDGEHTFVFHYKNTGESPLIISQLSPTCSCVIPAFSTDPLAPGDSTSFTVRYKAPHTGNFSQMVTVFSNGVKPILRVYIRGNVTEAEEKKE